jgi:hypothetical protein
VGAVYEARGIALQSQLNTTLATLQRLLNAKENKSSKDKKNKKSVENEDELTMSPVHTTASEILKVHVVKCVCCLLRALREVTNREVVTQLTLEGFRAVRHLFEEGEESESPPLRAAALILMEELAHYLCAPASLHVLRTSPVKEKEWTLALDTLATLALAHYPRTERVYAILLALGLRTQRSSGVLHSTSSQSPLQPQSPTGGGNVVGTLITAVASSATATSATTSTSILTTTASTSSSPHITLGSTCE